jgi:hypothetical protein
MGSRERRRAERRKRKRRSLERTAADGEPAAEQGDETEPRAGQGEEADAAVESQPGEDSFAERMARRSEERNQEARAKLKPLAPGERPTAVTVGAAISVVFALIFTVSAVVAAIGSVEIEGEEPSAFPLALFAAVLWMMAWGLWRSRYWAVLGFQMLLVLVLLASGLGLVQVATVLQAIGTVVLLLGSGALFYFMIRAMARIQMPERPRER